MGPICPDGYIWMPPSRSCIKIRQGLPDDQEKGDFVSGSSSSLIQYITESIALYVIFNDMTIEFDWISIKVLKRINLLTYSI